MFNWLLLKWNKWKFLRTASALDRRVHKELEAVAGDPLVTSLSCTRLKYNGASYELQAHNMVMINRSKYCKSPNMSFPFCNGDGKARQYRKAYMRSIGINWI